MNTVLKQIRNDMQFRKTTIDDLNKRIADLTEQLHIHLDILKEDVEAEKLLLQGGAQ